MKKWILTLGVLAALALGVGVATKWGFRSDPAVAQAPARQQGRVIAVDVATAVKKSVPVRVDALGTVTPIASVAVKTRVDSAIVAVHFSDGATVKQGELLFTLDSRAIEAQIKQVQGVLTSAKAQLEQVERDVERYTELVARNATTQVILNNARTQLNIARAAVESNTAQLEHLRVQLDYTSIRAPITGRVSMAAVKLGNFVRQADATPLATIIQTAPVYVSFTLPQRYLPELRQSLRNETASIQAIIPGDPRRASGQVTMHENTVDPTTGTVIVRATMPNDDEILWPGTLVSVQLTLRDEEAVTVPSAAVQVSQTGTFVFVVKKLGDDRYVANVQPVKVARVVDGESIIESGLAGGDSVVTEGQLQLTNGSRIRPRAPKPGA